jgi:hypothetical protein
VLRRLSVRYLLELLLAIALVALAFYLFFYIPRHSRAGEPVLALADYFLTYSPIGHLDQTEFVVPDSLDVWDTPAEIRTRIASLTLGTPVRALGRFRGWTHVRMLGGQEGWVGDEGLMTAATHRKEQLLTEELSHIPAQATGHTDDMVNLHIGPSRGAALVTELRPDQALEVVKRKMLPRSPEDSPFGTISASARHLEAWYLVRAGSQTGWILGRLLQLDIPKSISAYAQETNLVAWLTLDSVDDNGRKVPQYLIADRVGTNACDFTHIRVLTWWKKHQTYAIAYREGGLKGYFPILVSKEGNVPYFRLRLVGQDGSRFQKIYGLFDTITRVTGTAGTWDGDETPAPLTFKPQRSRSGLFAGRRSTMP